MESSDRSKNQNQRSDESCVRVAYHSGDWIASNELKIPITDSSFTQAVTAVERIRAYGGKLFQLHRHLDRWQRTIDALKIDGLPNSAGIESLIHQLVAKNAASLATWDDFGVLMVASPGSAVGDPTLIIDLYPIDSDDIQRRVQFGSPLVVTDVHQPPANCWPRDIKVRCRLHYYLADRQAREKVDHAYGVLLDSDGTITETSIANVLIVEQGRLISPLWEQILPGISLQLVRDLANEAKVSWSEERISPQRLCRADEVLLTGTRCGLWFCNSVDGGTPADSGPCYRKLRQAFDSFVRTSMA